MKEQIAAALGEAFGRAAKHLGWSQPDPPSFEVEIPRDESHGDFASNVAMVSAKALRSNPRKIAEALQKEIQASAPPWLAAVEIAGPGFLNFRIRPAGWFAAVDEAVRRGREFGRGGWGRGQRVLLEFVSANPTGPLHVGHARGCALGDALCRILRVTGHEVVKEFYVNDVGLQVTILAQSLLLRYWQHLGRKDQLPEDHYQGDYLKDLAARVAAQYGSRFLDSGAADVLHEFKEIAIAEMLAGIRQDMSDFGLEFDAYYPERTLYEKNLVPETLAELRRKGFLDDKDGAVWFKSSQFGDEKDRVVVRENGVHTYFASDIAYHRDKYRRGFDKFINIWGADHHGYIPRVKAALEALGLDAARLHILLVQFVNLVRGGERVAMGKRSGSFETLRDLLGEVGSDATRFLFLMRSPDSTFDFDLDVAKKKTLENPVFYVQYAHARIHSFFGKAREARIPFDPATPLDPAQLTSPEELDLARRLMRFPSILEACARTLQVHLLPHYLLDLARAFSGYYTARPEAGGGPKFKVVDPSEPGLTQARLKLALAVAFVLGNGLECLGVSAPERMESLGEGEESR